MPNYYVNRQADKQGDHEVHADGCSRMPSDKHGLGEHASCGTAVLAAKKIYPTANGCFFCSKECHSH